MKNNTINNDKIVNKTEITNDIEEEENCNNMSISEDSDPMSIEISEGRWISFIPGLTLTSATILFAFIGMAIGLIIALTGDQETEIIINETKIIYHDISLVEAQENNKSYPDMEMKLIDGEQYIIYTETINVTNTTVIPTDKLSDTWSDIIAFPGQLWLNALKLLVLPLIIIMMIILPSRVDEIGNIGKKALPLYIFTSLSASILGTIIAWTVKPGSIVDNGNVDNIGNDIEAPEEEKTITEVILDVFYNAVPDNIIISMMEFKIFGIIVFFLCIGLLLRNKKIVPLNEKNIVLKFNKAILRCIMKALVYVIWFSPFGMCSLICLRIAETEELLNLLISLGFYLLCIVLGCFCHLFIFYPILMAISVRGNAYKFFSKFYQAPLLAFATSSSAATLPRSLQMAENAGIRSKIYQFILPLGSAINMDGSAIGYPIQIALIAQLNGITLDIGTILIITLLSVIVSIGAAPIPNAGMVYVMMLFEAAGLSEYAGQAIGTLFVLDWLIDRMQTAVNVSSDQFIAKIIDDIDKIEKNYKENKNIKILCGCCVCGKINKGSLKTSYDEIANSNIQMQTI